ncbi:MAG: DNA-binding protein [Bacteroidetes bacterium]|nr:MAG: DNA-binding protein [Bacteroidota bacterium]
MIVKKYSVTTICLLLISFIGFTQQTRPIDIIEKNFLNPPESAKPWVFWYWMHGAVSKEGITADLEAMKEVGIGGAYLMPIKDTSSVIPFQPTVRQLTPEWWEMVKFSMQEAKRLKLKLAMHVSDGFALAGGPWITPELSMQKLTWTKTYIRNGYTGKINLEQPETKEDFYKEVAVFAYPANSSYAFRNEIMIPTVSTSNGVKAPFLSYPDADNKQSFKSDTNCWIQYKYPQPFTCRSIRIHTGTNSYQAQRLVIQTSEDGINFKTVTRLEPPRHGWQDTEEDYTHAIPLTTSKYFRFVYDKEGSEPGAEDLDAAKWKPSLKVMGIYLSDEPVINQYQSKNGSVWRVAANTTTQQVNEREAVSLKTIIDLTGKLDADGNLNWTAPQGNWVVVRIGHTTTGQTNATGGAGKGLECDKFNAAAIKLQFDNWFGKAFEKTDPALAKEVLKIFHVDSWECGSQNWSKNFAAEFKKRRGYDLVPYLLVMTGVPIESAERSEKILHDVRTTIAELVNDVFYVTLKKLSAAKGCQFSAESIAPTFVSDGLLHYKNVDLPMGEFWLNSPTHDKPNDMFDAISAAHIYGKNIIQAEAFTSVRMNWGEHPGNLKAIGDRNFALGINKMVLHVWTHNPWLNKKPGMTLDGVGLYFQRDQTWFKQSKAWIEYLTRCQALLQLGKPVVDIAVFTGEEIPRRSVLPDRLVNTLPGIFGKEKVDAEKKRLENTGQPMRQIPDGVSHSANMADPEDWIDPLNGYKYDSFNPDVLMTMKVVNGRVVTPGGASYAVLIIPGKHPMNPNGTMSTAVLNKLKQLANAGAKIIVDEGYIKSFNGSKNVFPTPYMESSFEKLGVKKDIEFLEQSHSVAWTHRKIGDVDIYFLSNQMNEPNSVRLTFRVNGKNPELWDPIRNTISDNFGIEVEKGSVTTGISLKANQSIFIIFRKEAVKYEPGGWTMTGVPVKFFSKKWEVLFNKNYGGAEQAIVFDDLISWSKNSDLHIKYYSGSAIYQKTFVIDKNELDKRVFVELDSIYNIATVRVNGMDCGTLWTEPYELNITKAIKQGENKIEIEVTNTWHNRLIGDNLLPPDKRITWTTAPFRLKDKPLLPAGIVGEVKLIFR